MLRRSPRAGNNGPAIALGILVVAVALFSLTTEGFLTGFNATSVLSRAVPLILVAIGTTYVLAAGEIDLSVGALSALGGVVFMLVSNAGQLPLAWLLVIAVGIVVGLVNSVLVGVVGITSFIATLATSFIATGLAFALSNSEPVRGDILEFTLWFEQPLAWIVSPRLALAIAAILIGHLVLTRTSIGRGIMASGGDRRVARLAGIRVRPLLTGAFVVSGVLAATAGTVVAVGLNTASPVAGVDTLLVAIAASIIGGSRLAGGEGSVAGTTLAVIALAAVGNGMNLLNVTPYGQAVVGGLILLAAVAADAALELRSQGRLRIRLRRTDRRMSARARPTAPDA